MKIKNSKKILGGAAIAAVSLGCLGLAGIANAEATGSPAAGAPASSQPYYTVNVDGALTGTTDITFNVSAAQGETLSSHKLEYVQIGSYLPRGSSFVVSATTQDIEDKIAQWATTAATDGGLKAAFSNASYDEAADGEVFYWLLTGNDGGTYLGADASGQADYGTSGSADYAVRLLANWLATTSELDSEMTSITLKNVSSSSGGYQEGTWEAPNPGIYLVLDTTSDNASMPIIIATKPSAGYSVPSSVANWITNSVALKTQDPQAVPVKQFVDGAKGGQGGTLSDSATSSVGGANLVTYQVSNVFPNTNGYNAYTYKFVDTPGTGLTLYLDGGNNMYVAGLPISSIPGLEVILDEGGTSTTYAETATTGVKPFSDLKIFNGNGSDTMTVSLNENSMQYIASHGYQTSNVAGKTANFSKLSSQSDISNTVNGTDNTMAGASKGATSYTGQTQPAASGENGNKATSTTPQAGGELFGLEYQAYLNTSVATDTSSGSAVTGASNSAATDNNGSGEEQSNSPTLGTSGSYNGGSANSSGTTGSTTQTSPDDVTGSHGDGSTDGIPNNTAVGAGINWMKIWGSGAVAQGAEFQVQNSSGDYLYSTGGGWAWGSKADAETFTATTLDKGSDAAAEGGLFQINGLADGTYTVSEVKAATGADQSVKPSFEVTLSSTAPEKITTSSASLNLVNNTPSGTPFNSTDFNTVENIKSLAGLPLTGGAGILTGVIVAVLLFGAAGIVLVAYKRRKQND